MLMFIINFNIMIASNINHREGEFFLILVLIEKLRLLLLAVPSLTLEAYLLLLIGNFSDLTLFPFRMP